MAGLTFEQVAEFRHHHFPEEKLHTFGGNHDFVNAVAFDMSAEMTRSAYSPQLQKSAAKHIPEACAPLLSRISRSDGKMQLGKHTRRQASQKISRHFYVNEQYRAVKDSGLLQLLAAHR